MLLALHHYQAETPGGYVARPGAVVPQGEVAGRPRLLGHDGLACEGQHEGPMALHLPHAGALAPSTAAPATSVCVASTITANGLTTAWVKGTTGESRPGVSGGRAWRAGCCSGTWMLSSSRSWVWGLPLAGPEKPGVQRPQVFRVVLHVGLRRRRDCWVRGLPCIPALGASKLLALTKLEGPGADSCPWLGPGSFYTVSYPLYWVFCSWCWWPLMSLWSSLSTPCGCVPTHTLKVSWGSRPTPTPIVRLF